MALGAYCYCFWILSFLLPAYYNDYYVKHGHHPTHGILNKTVIKIIILITSAINGAGAGIMWISEGHYLSKCACESNKGLFNSWLWAWEMSS